MSECMKNRGPTLFSVTATPVNACLRHWSQLPRVSHSGGPSPPLPTCVFSNSQRVANPLPWLQPAPPARLIPPSHLIIILSTFNESFSSPSPTQALADYCNLFDSQGIHQEGGKGPGASFPFQKLSFLSCKLGMP